MKNSKFLFLLISLLLVIGVISCEGIFPKDEPEMETNTGNDDCYCINYQVCINGICECPQGYSGTQCEIDDCASVVCLNGGACINSSCVCPQGYTGTNCEIPIDPCSGVSCVNGDLESDCHCKCDDGWTGDDCNTPLPDSYTFIPGPLLDICPNHIGGNKNFAGSARIDIDCRAFVLNDKDIFVDVRFHAKQTNDDWTEGLYDGNIHIYSAPNGKKINRIVSSKASTGDYVDNDNARDIIYTTGLVNYFGVLGETSNDDFVDYRDCTADHETELNIYFNQMTIELVDE